MLATVIVASLACSQLQSLGSSVVAGRRTPGSRQGLSGWTHSQVVVGVVPPKVGAGEELRLVFAVAVPQQISF